MKLDALARLRIPFFVMLDNVRPEVLKAHDWKGYRTDEEDILLELKRLASSDPALAQESVTLLPFPGRDIVYALPEAAVRAAVQKLGGRPDAFLGWKALRETFDALEKRDRPKFKDYVLSALGLGDVTPTTFIDEALVSWDGRLTEHAPLQAAIDALLAAGPDSASGLRSIQPSP